MNTSEKDSIVYEKIIENKRSYYLRNCPSCGQVWKVRSDYINKIKSCHPCHHKVSRPEKPDGNFHWCNKCKNWKDALDFNFRKNGIRMCKSCETNYRKKNQKEITRKAVEWSKLNKEKKMFYAAKCRAKINNIPFNLEISDIVVPEYCPVLGFKLILSEDKNTSPSLDRIVPELGYIKGNVRVISWRANWLKNNATLDEIKCLYLYLEKINGKN